jgi:selenocysteine-specific translation elongation factor
MINMLKNSKDASKEDKISNYENKKLEELETYHREFNDKKNSGTKEIKERYNLKCLDI